MPPVDFDQQLEEEIKAVSIQERARGFAVSEGILYKTIYTTIVAYAFHIPDGEGKIHHFDLKIKKYVRKKKSEPWEAVLDEIKKDLVSDFLSYSIHLNLGNGLAVKNLTEFLNAQFEVVGKKVEKVKVVIDNPEEIDIQDLLVKVSAGKTDELNFQSRIQSLKNYRAFLAENLDKNEKFIQDWLDEEKGKYRKQRCLIFGLEFIDHKREGELSRKRFDILTKTSELNNEYVLFELKSPCDDMFQTKEVETGNGGKSTEYHLSPQVARSIPQILHYKSLLESKPEGDDDLQRIGINAGKVSKCIILIGQRKNDPVWESHFQAVKNNFSNTLEIWTYTDLLHKLDVTIKNLEENL